MKRILTLLVVLGCLAAVPTATATTSVSGTVTVDGDTADGAQVTVVPVTESLQRAGDPARTTVSGSSFSVDVADAPNTPSESRTKGRPTTRCSGTRRGRRFTSRDRSTAASSTTTARRCPASRSR
ncbi:hypothetical protein ACFQL0_15630 [Haloplanus litoreus]|uniref:hypothetical protein n=1 Tax=Haloplanus litoreus TaxID=767515 RepID=UPI003609D012